MAAKEKIISPTRERLDFRAAAAAAAAGGAAIIDALAGH